MAAGEWLAIRVDLITDPAVIAVTAACREHLIDEAHTVGKLVQLWGWAHLQTADGWVAGVTAAWINRYVAVPGFAEALASLETPWLVLEAGGLRFPNWDDWNSSSAKLRLLDSKRKRRGRAEEEERKRQQALADKTRTNVQPPPDERPAENGQTADKVRTTGPDRTGPENISRRSRAGYIPGSNGHANPDRQRLRKGPSCERQNGWQNLLERPLHGVAWEQRLGMVLFDACEAAGCKMGPAEWTQNRANVFQIAKQIASRADRDAVGAWIIEQLLRCRAAAQRGKIDNAWAVWQTRIKRELTASQNGGT